MSLHMWSVVPLATGMFAVFTIVVYLLCSYDSFVYSCSLFFYVETGPVKNRGVLYLFFRTYSALHLICEPIPLCTFRWSMTVILHRDVKLNKYSESKNVSEHVTSS